MSSEVGRGRLGLRSGLRDAIDLADSSACDNLVAARLLPGLKITSTWTAIGSAGAYVTEFEASYDGVVLDVVTLRSTSAVLFPTVGIDKILSGETVGFYYQPHDIPGKTRRLYIYLTGGANPNSETAIMAQLMFTVANKGLIEPVFDSNDILNGGGGFESSTGAGLLGNYLPTGWLASASAAGWFAHHDSAVKRVGSYGMRLYSDGGASGDVQLTRDAPSVALSGASLTQATAYGVMRLHGRYRTPPTLPSTAQAEVTVWSSAVNMSIADDGRARTIGAVPLALNPTWGEWRHFIFDFMVTPEDVSLTYRFGLSNSAATKCCCWFDHVGLRRVRRYAYYEPRLAAAPVQLEAGSRSIWFDRKQTGSGAIVINNDGTLEEAHGRFRWTGQEVQVFYGGAFPDGQELAFENWRERIWGTTRQVKLKDERASYEVDDSRGFFTGKIPRRTYDTTTFPNLDTRAIGKTRPLLFGQADNITPTRVDNVGGGLGRYEVCDPTDKLGAGLVGDLVSGSLWAYENEEAAGKQDSNKRVALVLGTNIVQIDGGFDLMSVPAPYDTVDPPIVRVKAKGFEDDASGTYTGTAGALIEKAADILRFLLNKAMRIGLEYLDTASFTAARTAATQALALYLGSEMELDAIVAQVEVSVNGDLVLGADVNNMSGQAPSSLRWFFSIRDTTVPSSILDLYDRDFLSWSTWKSTADVFRTVKLSYARDPSSGVAKALTSERTEVGILDGGEEDRLFETALTVDADASARLTAIHAAADEALRMFAFSVKGRLIDYKPGDKVRLNREQGWPASGSSTFAATVVRILHLRQDYTTKVSEVLAVENVV